MPTLFYALFVTRINRQTLDAATTEVLLTTLGYTRSPAGGGSVSGTYECPSGYVWSRAAWSVGDGNRKSQHAYNSYISINTTDKDGNVTTIANQARNTSGTIDLSNIASIGYTCYSWNDHAGNGYSQINVYAKSMTWDDEE